MGLYVNPHPDTGQTKLEYLEAHGEEVDVETALNFIYDGKTFPVIWLDNGPFDAAAVAVDEAERKYFLVDTPEDPRPKRIFMVPAYDLGLAAGLDGRWVRKFGWPLPVLPSASIK